jgi:hypothetical protein
MSRWGVDWMGVANGSKDFVEEVDHVCPLSQEFIDERADMSLDPKLLQSILALFALVKDQM